MSDAQDADETVNHGWFSVRCVLQYGSDAPFVYEERITVWRAVSFDAAVALAEAEAAEYANKISCSYLGFAQAYRMFDELGYGAEVYSLMRDSELPPDAYLTAFFDTGEERHETLDEPAADQQVQQRSTATHRAEPIHEEHRTTS
ncbi:hypothetical protein [Micromonospora sp. RTGN7]|uniref:hypothetical protein n=1 Tax=Micromonospora sp. RTGN7 TaxID=3016526 RepID=UPI0029FF029A|nr:hypothetical protein [Micromonospora sp. RTGN7]